MNRHEGQGSVSRSATVWLVVTGAAGAALWWLLPDLAAALRMGGSTTTLESAVGQLAAVAAAACAVWGWTVTSAIAVLAATGRGRTPVPGCPRAWRGMVLAACGVAVFSGVGVPAHAGDGRHETSRRAAAVAGLPLPDRPAGGVSHRRPPALVLVVEAGDSLWSLAAGGLSDDAGDDGVTAAWRRLYAANRVAIGPDPDLLIPGQRLRVPTAGVRR